MAQRIAGYVPDVNSQTGHRRARLLAFGLVIMSAAWTSCGSTQSSGAPTEPSTGNASATAAVTAAPAVTTAAPADSSTLPAALPATLLTTVPVAVTPSSLTPSTVSPVPGALERCHASALVAALGQAEGAAGSTYTPLVVRNVGTEPCLLSGRPGVSLLDASGVQIGQPATKDSANTAKSDLTLEPNSEASALLHTTNGPIGDPCTAQSVQIKVYPPNEFDPIVFPALYTACGGFSVRPFVPGITGI